MTVLFVAFCYIFRSDIDGSLTALEYSVKHYNKVPSYSSILRMLIEAEDAGRLQKGICAVCLLLFDKNRWSGICASS